MQKEQTPQTSATLPTFTLHKDPSAETLSAEIRREIHQLATNICVLQISVLVIVLAVTAHSAVGAPGIAAPVAYAAAPAYAAAYARAVPYNIPPFAAALNVQTRGLAAPLLAPAAYATGPVVAPAAYAAAPVGPIAAPIVAPAAYAAAPAAYAAAPAAYAAAPAGIAPAYTVSILCSDVSNGVLGFIRGYFSVN
jgi:hypothetical protein